MAAEQQLRYILSKASGIEGTGDLADREREKIISYIYHASSDVRSLYDIWLIHEDTLEKVVIRSIIGRRVGRLSRTAVPLIPETRYFAPRTILLSSALSRRPNCKSTERRRGEAPSPAKLAGCIARVYCNLHSKAASTRKGQ
jgi:hypothetical protein